MVEVRCADGILRKDTHKQAEIRKTKPWAQACPERFQFNGLPYVRGRRRDNTSPEQIQDALQEAARRVGRRRLQELRHTVDARKPLMQKPAADNEVAQLEFLHSEKDRKAAQDCLDMIEWMRAASPDFDDELVAYMLELNLKAPQVFAGFFGKLLSMQTPEQNSEHNSGRPLIRPDATPEEVLAVYKRLGIPVPDRLKAMLAEQAAGKEPVQTATR